MTYQIAVRIPENAVEEIDRMVGNGIYPNRSAAIKAGVEQVIKINEREQIADEYRRAYEKKPQDSFGEAGAKLLAELMPEDEKL